MAKTSVSKKRKLNTEQAPLDQTPKRLKPADGVTAEPATKKQLDAKQRRDRRKQVKEASKEDAPAGVVEHPLSIADQPQQSEADLPKLIHEVALQKKKSSKQRKAAPTNGAPTGVIESTDQPQQSEVDLAKPDIGVAPASGKDRPQKHKKSRKLRKEDGGGPDAETLDPVERQPQNDGMDLDEPSHEVALVSSKKVQSEEKGQRRLAKREKRDLARQSTGVVQSAAKDPNQDQNGWSLTPSQAGRYLNHDPIFVEGPDGQDHLIAANSCQIQLLSMSTSLPIRVHTVPEKRAIVCFSLSPVSDDVVDIAYDDGTKVQWMWTTGQVTEGKFPVREEVLALGRTSRADSPPESLHISRKKTKFSIFFGKESLFTTTQPLDTIQAVGDARYIIATGRTAIVLGKRKRSGTDYIWVEMPMTMPLTCVDARLVAPQAVDKKPSAINLSLAVGNANGQIHLYSDLAHLFSAPSEARLLSPRILHWHRESVSAVKFSKDGSYLISGGRETVIVLWQLETGQKQFLPHLTSEIERIVVSPSGTQYALQMGDNSIMVLSTSELKPVANFAGLQLPVKKAAQYDYDVMVPKATVVFHPKHSQQLLLTVPSTQPKLVDDISARPFLQTFDLRNSRHMSRQALTRNSVTDFVSGPEGNRICPPDIPLLAINMDGNWLATIDEWIPPASDLEHAVPRVRNLGVYDLEELREQQERRREVYLKFWQWDQSQDMWTLSTRVDAPHLRSADADAAGRGAGRVFALASDPATNGFATTGEDGRVRLWTPKVRTRHGAPMKDQNGTDLFQWVCKNNVSIPSPLPEIATRADSPLDAMPDIDQSKQVIVLDASLAYSQDGSVLACAQITLGDALPFPPVYLISPRTGKLTPSPMGLAVPEQDVEHVGFLERYLITVSTRAFRVWNLVEDRHYSTVTIPGMVMEESADQDVEPPLFAVNDADETFALAYVDFTHAGQVGYKLRVYSPRKPEFLVEMSLKHAPVAMLTAKGVKGYTIIFEDGTIRTLGSTISANEQKILALTAPEEEAADATVDAEAGAVDESVDLEMEDALALPKEESSGDLRLVGEGEDDRPVVRPEQLAAIFDVGPSFTLPSMKDMFQAVVGLYGRPPLKLEERVLA